MINQFDDTGEPIVLHFLVELFERLGFGELLGELEPDEVTAVFDDISRDIGIAIVPAKRSLPNDSVG